MYLILNSDNEIKGVGVITNPEYKSVYVDENADMFPFKDWSEAKICCYKVNVVDGIITMMTPYVDSRLIEHIEQLGKQIQDADKNVSETNDGLIETYEDTLSNRERLSQCEDAIIEIYEMLLGEEE